jgi:5-methyltetrahydropteroyltriglutamate--homocysteine methyltransferase
MEILTASVGSYPRIGDRPEQQRHRQAHVKRELGEMSEEEFERVQDEVTREVIEEQVKAGLDVVTDGQVRWYDPISHFTRKLEGCEINGLLRFFDTNFYFRQPVVKGGLSRREPVMSREFLFAEKVSSRPVKPVVTGPYTLAKLSINRSGEGFQSLVDEFAEFIAQEVSELARAGAGLIQIDEPAILRNPSDFQIFREAIERVVAYKNGARLALYTYFGDAAPLYEQLLELPVDALGFDFTYSPKLPGAIAGLGCEKDLGLGLIDGRNTRLEDEGAVLDTLKLILPKVEAERVYVGTSCGLGEYLPREIAFRKLQSVTAIVRRSRILFKLGGSEF